MLALGSPFLYHVVDFRVAEKAVHTDHIAVERFSGVYPRLSIDAAHLKDPTITLVVPHSVASPVFFLLESRFRLP